MAAAAVAKKRQRADDVATPKSAAESAAAAAAATTLLKDLQDFDFEEGERQRSIRMIVEGLLTQKEKLTDGLLMLLTEQQQQAFEDKSNGSSSSSSSSNNSSSHNRNRKEEEDKDKFFFYDGVSEDDKQFLIDAAKEKLSALSPVACSKLLPLVVKQLVDEHEKRVSRSFGHIRLRKTAINSMAKMYRTAFAQWIDSPYVSFVAGNPTQLGKLTAKECFVLHVYSFVGCFRAKPDDLYCIALTGETSVGKSLIFENPFSSNCHQYISSEGCGRWHTGKHSMVMYHDINLSVLLKPSECEMFKTLARTEMSAAKVHSGAAYVPTLFVFVTSNQRVHSHTVSEPTRELRERIKQESEHVSVAKASKKKENKPPAADYKSRQLLLSWRGAAATTSNHKFTFEEQNQTTARSPLNRNKKPGSSRNAVHLESNLRPSSQHDCPNIRAVQSRILEAHCHQRPELDPACIPRGETFTRAHVLLGVYQSVLDILESHEREDFYSPPIISYALTTLCMVSKFFSRNMEGEDGEGVERRLRVLIERLEPDLKERQLYFNLI
jgi:hypothetical protein